ncbi:MAG: response regulator [Mucilaginibacter sp.]
MDRIKKIMIADDDPAILDSVGILLEFEGYDVTTTLNGGTVLNMEHELPDLLLLDIWMSGMDGRDICKTLKQNEKTRGLPIVMISASKDIERSAIEAGADDFLAKPFDMNDLLGKIEKNTLK